MKSKFSQNLTPERLKEVVIYNPNTGIFIRRDKPEDSKPLGSNHSVEGGYLKFSVDGVLYYAHRLAWLYVYGKWPNGIVDHVNREKSDNRICNLKVSDHSQNGHNSNLSRANKTGFIGVTFVSKIKKYRSCIVKDRKRIHLGYFNTAEEAHDAYLAFKRSIYQHE